MTHFEKKILGNLEVCEASVQYCDRQLFLYKETIQDALDIYYASKGSDVDLEDFNRKVQLAKYVQAIYTAKKNILVEELRLWNIEVTTRLV